MTEPEEITAKRVEERLEVDTVERETGRVRVRLEPRQWTERVEMDLDRTEAEITRTPVDRVVEAVPEVRREGDVLVYPVVEERAVVRTELVLVEEVRVRLTRRTETVAADVELHGLEPNIERSVGEA